MTQDAEYEEFVAFVARSEAELRNAARLAVADPGSVELLMRRTLAAVAQRWRLARADDPERFLLDEVENQAHSLWRDEVVTVGDDDHTGVSTALSLADEAWSSGMALRARRRRKVFVMAAVAVLVVGSYLWSVSLDPVAGPPESSPSMTISVTESVSVLPPPTVVDEAPAVFSQMPENLDRAALDAQRLSASPVDAFDLAFQVPGKRPIIVSREGEVRIVNAPGAEPEDPQSVFVGSRSINFDGTKLALRLPDEIMLIDTAAQATHLDLPEDIGEPIDLAWFPDGSAVAVTTDSGSYQLDVDSGEVTDLPWYGSSTTFDPHTQQPVEFIALSSPAITLQSWNGLEPGSPTVAKDGSLPFDSWEGVPFTDDMESGYTRECHPGLNLRMPSNYGIPHSCVAKIGLGGDLQQLLVLTDEYTSGTVLAFARSRVYLAVRTPTGTDQMVLSWWPAKGELKMLAVLDSAAQLAIGPVNF